MKDFFRNAFLCYSFDMPNAALIAALLATVGSMIELTKIATRNHNTLNPKPLSELAAAEARILDRFRGVLIACGALFSLSIYGFIGPQLPHGLPIVLAWTWTFLNILLVAILPMRGRTYRVHIIAAQLMGLGMLIMAYIFWKSIEGVYADVELIIALAMTILAASTYVDARRYIVYELAFIYFFNFTIVTAVLSLYPK